MRVFLQPRHLVQLIEQLVRVELVVEERQPVKTERLPNADDTQTRDRRRSRLP